MDIVGDLGDVKKIQPVIDAAETKLIEATTGQFIPALAEHLGAALDPVVQKAIATLSASLTANVIPELRKEVSGMLTAEVIPALREEMQSMLSELMDGLGVVITRKGKS